MNKQNKTLFGTNLITLLTDLLFPSPNISYPMLMQSAILSTDISLQFQNDNGCEFKEVV
jgi:hypothetical protein